MIRVRTGMIKGLAVISAFFLSLTIFARAQETPMSDSIHVQAHSLLYDRASAGDPEAMSFLGYLLLSGEEGMERNVASGLSWLSQAASAGDIKAASNLGWLYIKGDLIERDVTKGAQWITTAAEAGLPVAISILGDLFLEGNGVPKDSIAADSLYREAFERGLADAGYKLAALNARTYSLLDADAQVEQGKYFYLRGAPSEGVKLFYLAAEQGNSDALALLGDAYTRGFGVPYDYDLSLKYYVEAALAGNPSAQFVVGELLEIFPDALQKFDSYGELPSSPSYWYDKAAAVGVSDADIAYRLLLETQPATDVKKHIGTLQEDVEFFP